jgi:hypothetical protein
MNDIQAHIAKIQKSASEDPRFKHNGEVTVTEEAVQYANKIFNSMLPHFPAWRQSCPDGESLGRLKSAWTKAIMRHELKTGQTINIRAGLLACEESDSDWLPSVGKFIKWCDQSGGLVEFSDRAYNLFINQQRQIDNVGQMVIARHGFDLKNMKAADCKKQFELYYLKYAESNQITALEAFSLTDGVSLSPEQEKSAQARTVAARDEFLSSVGQLIGKPVIEPIKAPKKKSELTTGKINTSFKSPQQMIDERDRQLAAVKHLLNKDG